MINRYHSPVEIAGPDVVLCRQLRKSAHDADIAQTLVKMKNLQARGGQ